MLIFLPYNVLKPAHTKNKTTGWLAFSPTQKQKNGENAKLYIGSKIIIKDKQLGYDLHGLFYEGWRLGESSENYLYFLLGWRMGKTVDFFKIFIRPFWVRPCRYRQENNSLEKVLF